ncbi:MAG: hypothetical protein KBA02_00060 [Paludibacteraceae bacterium]|nr:hypothetical protein [Paludibacteraceae bacterium]
MSTRAQLRARVRSYLDEASASYWTDNELNNWIEQAYNYYYMWVIQTFDGYFAKDILMNIVAGQAKYALPSDFFKIRLLERVYPTQTIPLKFFDRIETPNIISGANYGLYNVPTYRFEGQNIVLEPTPDASFTNALRLEYYPQPTTLSAESSTLDDGYLPLWEEPLVLRAVISAKQKSETVTSGGEDIDPLWKQVYEFEQNIKESAEQRTIGRKYTEVFASDDLDLT